MGCVSSSDHKPSSKLKVCNTNKNDNIRVVHFDGRIEDYDKPIKVNQIIHNPTKDVLCTKSQLLCRTSSIALKSDCELELGNLYFLMPISAFTSEASMMDMANMVNKLTNIAKNTRVKECSNSKPVSVAVGPAGYGSDEPGRVEVGEGFVERFVWKPVLETIGEKSLNGRSESDLQDQQSFSYR
ncbi:unnamed protein product [Rhodiola kirilowii]